MSRLLFEHAEASWMVTGIEESRWLELEYHICSGDSWLATVTANL